LWWWPRRWYRLQCCVQFDFRGSFASSAGRLLPRFFRPKGMTW
jgi:hypothetical protein